MKKGMNININIQKKNIWFLTGLILLLSAIGVVYAYTYDSSGNPEIMGHSADEIEGGGAGATYDSGWFAVTGGQLYPLNHNLGTSAIITQLLWAPDSGGSPDLSNVRSVETTRWGAGALAMGAQIKSITDSSLTIIPATSYISDARYDESYAPASGWYRMIASTSAGSGASAGFVPSVYNGGQSVTFPNGLVMKNGKTNIIAVGGTEAITFQIPFPNFVSNIIITRIESTTSNSFSESVFGMDKTGFTVYSNGARAGEFYWQAWGY